MPVLSDNEYPFVGWEVLQIDDTIITYASKNELSVSEMSMLKTLTAKFAIPSNITFNFTTTGLSTSKNIYAIIQSGEYVSMLYIKPNAQTSITLVNVKGGIITITFKGANGLNVTGLTTVNANKNRYSANITGDTTLDVTISS